MFKEILGKLQQAVAETIWLPRENDLDILEELYKARKKQKQYDLERLLRGAKKKIAHSTVTGKLQRLCKCGFINAVKEERGLTYYELTPTGLGLLFVRGRVNFDQALTFSEDNQKQYFEFLARLQPNLIERLEKKPPWFVTQLTPSLWAIYSIVNRPDLRKKTLKFAIELSRGDEAELSKFVDLIHYEMQLLCIHRIEVEGEEICVKQRTKCVYTPKEAPRCEILKDEMQHELENLESSKPSTS